MIGVSELEKRQVWDELRAAEELPPLAGCLNMAISSQRISILR